MADPQYRRWLVLRALPRAPQKTTVARVHAVVEAAGVTISRRGIERDLVALSRSFPIESDEGVPAGWRWSKTAETVLLPAMDPQAALAFRVVEMHVAALLPRSAVRALEPHFALARTTLGNLTKPGLGTWLDGVRVIPRSQPLLAPDAKPAVVDAIYEAVLDNRVLEASYRPRGAPIEKKLELHPLGLVFKDSLVFLLATAFAYQDVRQYALHRFVSAKGLEQQAKASRKKFDIDRFIEGGELGYLLSRKPRQVRALFHPDAAPSVVETPLARDQKVSVQSDGWVLIEATLPDTAQLRAFLTSFGTSVRVER